MGMERFRAAKSFTWKATASPFTMGRRCRRWPGATVDLRLVTAHCFDETLVE
jgi:hypothetical protein